MAYASITYTSASGTTFALTNSNGDAIEYLRQSDIAVTVNGVLQTVTTDYTYNAAGTAIVLNSSVSNATVVIARTTDIADATVSFTAGSTLTAQDLNNSDKQNRFALQEFSDTYGGLTTGTGDLSALAGFIGGSETWVSDDAHAATTAGIDARIDEKTADTLTDDVIAGNAITISDDTPSTGQITIAVTNGAIDTAELADDAVTTAKIADSNVTTAKINNDAVTTAKILDGNVTTAKLANDAVTSAKIADGTIVAGDLANNAVTTAKILDANVTTAKILDGNVTTAKINDGAVTEGKIASGAVTATKIGSGAVDSTKLSSATIVTAAEQSGHTTADTDFFTTAATDARYFRQDSSETISSGDTWSGSDSYIATTAAIDARIVDLVDDVGGFVPIANETSFPTYNPDINVPPDAGTIISVKEIVTTRTPAAGVVTITNGAGSNTVTINGCGSTVLASGFGVLVETTSTLHTYTFHRLVPKATEVTTVAGISSDITTVATNVSDVQTVATNIADVNTVATNIADVNTVGTDIADVSTVATNITDVNTFANVYRIAASDPTTSLDVGDLVFNTTDNKIRIYNGSSWQDGVTATGDIVSKTGDTMTGAFGIISGTAAAPGLFVSGDLNTGIYSPGADQVAVSTGGSQRLLIDSSGNINIDSNTLYVDAANNRVGLGTNSPVATNHIRGSGTSGQVTASWLLENGSSGTAGMDVTGSAGSSIWRFLYGGGPSTGTNALTPAISIGLEGSAAGNVGIGDNAPGTYDVRAAKLVLGDSASDGIGVKGRRNSLDRWYVGYNSGDQLEINQIRNNQLVFKANNTEYARLTNDGKLLVGTSTARTVFGTTSPKFLVESVSDTDRYAQFAANRDTGNGFGLYLLKSRGTVNGSNTVVQSGDSLGFIAFQGTDGSARINAATIETYVDGTPGANDMPGRLVFSTTADGASSPTERMRIGSDGFIGVNSGLNPSTTVFGTKIGYNLTSTTVQPGTFYTAADLFGVSVVAQFAGNAGVAYIRGDGDLENTNNNYTGISDIKLKENIVNASSQWDDLKALQVRNYNFKAETGFNTHTQIGLIAQEVELVSPGLVGETIDEETGDSTKSVSYSVLYMKAVKALQEAMERIETLEAEVAALKGS